MSRHDLSWRDQLSFRYATRQSRREAVRNALLVVGLVLAYGIVGTVDYQIEQRIAAERQLASETAYAKVLRDCMSGSPGFYFPDSQRAFECKVQPL